MITRSEFMRDDNLIFSRYAMRKYRCCFVPANLCMYTTVWDGRATKQHEPVSLKENNSGEERAKRATEPAAVTFRVALGTYLNGLLDVRDGHSVPCSRVPE